MVRENAQLDFGVLNQVSKVIGQLLFVVCTISVNYNETALCSAH